MTRLSTTTLLLTGLALSAGCKLSCLAPKAEQIDSPIAGQLNATLRAGAKAETSGARPAVFDHAVWQTLVQEHADFDSGRVDYAGFKRDAKRLEQYTAGLADVTLNEQTAAQQKALLINAYNAFTIQLMVENYPGIESIKDLDSPWKQKRWVFAKDTVSLDDIEHGLLRATYKDPRIHFAVNCASIGCPPLANFAFEGAKLDQQLEEVTTAALRNPRYAAAKDGTLRLTKIMNWYGDDFTEQGWSPRADSLPEFVGRYAAGDVKTLIAKRGADTPIDFFDYDWSINDVER